MLNYLRVLIAFPVLAVAADSPAKQYFTDVPLLNQNGQQVRFYSDLLQGKTVIINSFFTSCDNSCPRMAATLAALQAPIGARLGKDVFIMSFSVDPETDTPERLKAYAERFHAKPGWVFLTGKKENVELALHKLGQKVDRKEDHFNLFIIGNEATGLWQKVMPMGRTAEDIMPSVEKAMNDHP